MGFARVAFGVLLLSVTTACRAREAPPPPPPPPEVAPGDPLSWSIVSFGGHATLSQTSLADTCSLECTHQGKRVWQRQLCLGRSTDFAFVADDCASGVIFMEYPLRSTPVALLLDGAGATVPITLDQVMRDPSRTRGQGRRIRWLAGVVGEPGVKPHLSAAGDAVEFATLDGANRSVRLSHLQDLQLGEPAPSAQAAGRAGLYQFVDDEGSTQFVMGIDQVPARFRKKATPVQAQVSAVKGVSVPARAASPSWNESPPIPTLSKTAPIVTPGPPPPLPGQPGSGAIVTCPFGINVFGGCGASSVSQ